jgi:acid phosphatase (class A)
MGGGWLGGGWQGGGWQGGGWQGGGWQSGPGGGGDGLYAMRADRPMVAKTTDPTYSPSGFPMHNWDADLNALAILPDFFGGTYNTQRWEDFIQVGPPPNVCPAGQTPNPGEDSIDDLRILAVTERPEAMGEILNQHQNQQLCFMHLLMMTQNSHPTTFFAMKLAARIGETVMIRLKRQWNRPRPSQYCPTLYPPVDVPGHASYPAGHALIARLTARVLIDATTKSTGTSPYEKSLKELADEIGFNRVIAGLHFRSDIQAGEQAGDLTHEFLKGMTPPSSSPHPSAFVPPHPPSIDYNTVIIAARAEWP